MAALPLLVALAAAGIPHPALAPIDEICPSARAPKEPVLQVSPRTQSTWNPELSRRLAAAESRSLGPDRVVDGLPVVASEDFTEFGRAGIPSAIFWLGAVELKALAAANAAGKVHALTILLFGCSDGSSDVSNAASPTRGVSWQASGNPTGPCAGRQTPKASMGKCQIGAAACQELANPDPSRAQSACSNLGGTWTAGQKCSTSGLVGRCMRYCKTNDEAVIFYYTDDETSWRNLCVEANGAWLGR